MNGQVPTIGRGAGFWLGFDTPTIHGFEKVFLSGPQPMRVTVNNRSHDLPEGATLETLLRELQLLDRPCAAEVNRTLVPKRSHATHALKDGDVVELVTLVGGG